MTQQRPDFGKDSLEDLMKWLEEDAKRDELEKQQDAVIDQIMEEHEQETDEIIRGFAEEDAQRADQAEKEQDDLEEQIRKTNEQMRLFREQRARQKLGK